LYSDDTISLDFAAIYDPLFTTKARYIDLWGGRGRGGSFTATQYFLHLITEPQYFRGYFMREIAGDVRESLWRDFKDRVDESDLNDLFDFNESTMTAVFKPTGNTILSRGFKKSSGNRTAKLKSLAGATHVIIEEAEEIGEDDFRQLDDTLRTKKSENIQIIRIFNPPSKNHWLWRRWYNLVPSKKKDGYYEAIPKTDPQLLSIHSTYLDNLKNIHKSSLETWSGYEKVDPEYYYTIICGLISEGVRGRIYKHFQVGTLPSLYPKFYGLDWGFNDPVALVECENHNKSLFVKELLYEQGLTNIDLSNRLTALGIKKTSPIYADSAEPKDILDMRRMGWNVIAAQKGPDSVMNGIKYLKQFDIFVEENSVNLWKESENYRWRLDQYKMPTNEPEDKDNHLMDALRYAMDKLKKPSGLRVI
jgi:phage terminase large subunit